MSSSDTIFALSTGRLPSGIAIVRLSGPHVRFAFETMFGAVPASRVATYGRVGGTETLDHGLALFFPGPASVTGEDCGEFHLHGGVAVVKAVLTMLAGLPGLRPAEAGEFTRRAFLNGKMDLTGAEALSDLIASETEQQRQLAEASGSKQRALYESWRRSIVEIRAGVESDLDFSDQEDVSGLDLRALHGSINRLASSIEAHAARFRAAEIVRSGYSVAIVGSPNAGKSSLLNALAMNDVAIVSDEAGTTRDPISVSLDIDGFKVVLTDTAGLRSGGGVLEKIGMERARHAARRADLILRLIDPVAPVFVEVESAAESVDVWTKSDLLAAPEDALSVSSIGEPDVGSVVRLIASRVSDVAGVGRSDVLPTRERHVRHLLSAAGSLRQSAMSDKPEIIAEELRFASVEIGRITGLTDTEELLGEIFSRFCIGK